MAIRSLIGFAIGSLIYYFWSKNLAYVVFGISSLTLVIALTSITIATKLDKALHLLSRLVGATITWVLLVPFFFAILTPLGLFMRIAKRDRLQRRSQPNAASYWTKHDRSGYSYESQS